MHTNFETVAWVLWRFHKEGTHPTSYVPLELKYFNISGAKHNLVLEY